MAESLGSLLDSGYSGGFVWDLRNYFDTSQNNSNLLYGWREGGDYGQLGDPNDNSPPTTGPYVAYPGYYALQLASKIIESGGQVVSAASNYSDLDVYAVKEASGDLDLLVINVNPAASLTEQFDLTGFQPGGSAQVWQYGETQDTAQSQSTTGASALASSSTSLSLSGSNFSYTFPAYSMTVLNLVPVAPTVATAAAAAPSTVTGTTTALSVLGADDGGDGGSSNLTYTWGTTGTPPAAVSFSANASNAAKNTTATFSKAGSYSILATITDPAGLSATSSVTVTVNQTLTSISTTLQPAATTAFDQFGNPMANQSAFDGGSGTISASLALGNNVTVLPAADSQLIISGGISGTGGLTIDAQGTVVLKGTNSYTGGTTVLAGTLILTNPAAIAAGTSLTIGAGGNPWLRLALGRDFVCGGRGCGCTGPDRQFGECNCCIQQRFRGGFHGSVYCGLQRYERETAVPRATSMVSSSPSTHFRPKLLLKQVSSKSAAAGKSGKPAVEQVVGSSTATRIAGDPVWLWQAANSSDTLDQRHKKDVAILALEAVFTRYGQ